MIILTAHKEFGRLGKIFDMSKLDTLGGRIFLARKSHDMNASELIEKLKREKGIDVTNAHMSRIENNKGRPSLDLVIAIADILNESIDGLLGRSIEIEEKKGAYFSPEAEEVANIVDKLDNDTKKIVVSLAHQLLEIDTERRALHSEMYELLQNNEGAIRDSDKPLAKSVLRQMGQHRTLSTGKR